MRLIVGYCEICDQGIVGRDQAAVEQASWRHCAEKRIANDARRHVVNLIELVVDEGQQRKISVPSQEFVP